LASCNVDMLHLASGLAKICPDIIFSLRVNSSSNKIYNFLKPYSVVNARGPQVFLAVRRLEDVTV